MKTDKQFTIFYTEATTSEVTISAPSLDKALQKFRDGNYDAESVLQTNSSEPIVYEVKEVKIK